MNFYCNGIINRPVDYCVLNEDDEAAAVTFENFENHTGECQGDGHCEYPDNRTETECRGTCMNGQCVDEEI
jgi:hypothetical protein